MFDYYKSYNEGLLLMGAFIALSGLMLYPIPCIRQALEKVGCSMFISEYLGDQNTFISDSQEGSLNALRSKV